MKCSVVQSPVVSDSLWPYGLQHARPPCPSPSPSLCSSPRVHVHCRGDVIQPSHLLKPSSPSAIDLSQYQWLFQWVVMWIRWPKYWCFTFSISPSSDYSRLISLKIDWFDLLAVQGTFRSVLQHHSWKTSILGRSDFSVVQKMLCIVSKLLVVQKPLL